MKNLYYFLFLALNISVAVNANSQTTVAIPVTGVSFSPNSGMVQIGTPVQLTPIVTPLSATNTTLWYKSNKQTLAPVDSLTGVVTGLLPAGNFSSLPYTVVAILMNKEGLTACPFRTDRWDYSIKR